MYSVPPLFSWSIWSPRSAMIALCFCLIVIMIIMVMVMVIMVIIATVIIMTKMKMIIVHQPDRSQPRLMVEVSVVQLLEQSSSVSSQKACQLQFWENTNTMQSKRDLF